VLDQLVVAVDLKGIANVSDFAADLSNRVDPRTAFLSGPADRDSPVSDDLGEVVGLGKLLSILSKLLALARLVLLAEHVEADRFEECTGIGLAAFAVAKDVSVDRLDCDQGDQAELVCFNIQFGAEAGNLTLFDGDGVGDVGGFLDKVGHVVVPFGVVCVFRSCWIIISGAASAPDTIFLSAGSDQVPCASRMPCVPLRCGPRCFCLAMAVSII